MPYSKGYRHGSGSARRDPYQQITERIASALEQGVAPWVRPWSRGDYRLRNAVSDRPYHGINVWLLALGADEGGYSDPRWLTYKQAKQAGGHVRKGEHGERIVYWNRVAVENDDGEKRMIPFLQTYCVFNAEQIDGVDLAPLETDAVDPVERDRAVEAFVGSQQADIRHGGGEAFYRPVPLDHIRLPNVERFKDYGAYAGTAIHELGHWTGAAHRLNRDLSGRFGSHKYAAEELIAELCSAFVCSRFRVDGTLQHESYIGSWIKVLRADSKALFTASRHAREAAGYLLENAGLPLYEEEAATVGADR
jgi:antirestriction protein ArdC